MASPRIQLALLLSAVLMQHALACTFIDNGSNDLAVECPLYAVTLSRENGALTSISVSDGAVLSRGSHGGCLFGMSGPNNSYCGSCGCSGGSPPTMAVTWINATLTLALTFTATSAAGTSSVVSLRAYDGEPFFDLSFRLVSSPTAGAGYFWLLFPSEILFDSAGLSALHVPILPGVSLGPGFFSRGISTNWYYPGSGGFAGWTHIDSVNGSLAIYDLSGPDVVAPYTTAPTPTAGPPYAESEWFLAVYHEVNITAGCSPTNVPGPAPPCALGANGTLARRFHVTPASSPASALETISAYAVDNGMVAGGASMHVTRHQGAAPAWSSPPFPTLREKLAAARGGGPDFWRQVLQAPLLKLDANAVGLPYTSYASQIYPGLPIPSLLHYCAYEQHGFDSNYPDMLPPASEFGSSCDMAQSMYTAASLGHLTMPYFNPTWWDPLSPTLSPLDGDFAAVAALNASGGAYYETYPDKPVAKTGVATCPWAPFVQARIAAELGVLSPNVSSPSESRPSDEIRKPDESAAAYSCNASDPVLPSTFVFEDQVSARWPHEDFSPFNVGQSYGGYTAGWLAHLNTWSVVGLHSEQGIDRMARPALGFHGTVLARVLDGSGDANWGAGNWAPEPLYGASGLRGVTTHFQHNLDGGAMARDVPELCWSVAQGVHLSLDLSGTAMRMNASWLAVVGGVQRVLLSRFADYQVLGYGAAGPQTFFRTSYDGAPIDSSYSVSYDTLWNADNSSNASFSLLFSGALEAVNFGLPPFGCAVVGGNASSSGGNDVLGGVFAGQYSGATLATGLHVIIEDRTCSIATGTQPESALCVFHPWGVDTPLTVALPLAWQQGVSVTVQALNASMGMVAQVPSNVSGAFVSFLWQQVVDGANVTAYAVVRADASRLG